MFSPVAKSSWIKCKTLNLNDKLNKPNFFISSTILSLKISMHTAYRFFVTMDSDIDTYMLFKEDKE